jgi:voltage-gated potassium channel
MASRPSSLQHRVFRLLDGRAEAGDPLDVAVHHLLFGIIVASVVTLIVATVPAVQARWGRALGAFDVVAGVVFLVEYVARVWTAPVDPRYGDGWRGRLRYMRSPLAVLDLVATLALLLPHLPTGLREARLVRLVALLRVGKFGRMGRSVTLAQRVFRSRRDDLLLALGAVLFVLLVGSSLMYFAENDAQPDKFGSIPASLWWGVVTLTTVGYGDVYPVTLAGRVLAGLIAMLGIASFALPTAILGGAFLDELQRMRGVEGHTTCPTCGRPVDNPGPAEREDAGEHP